MKSILIISLILLAVISYPGNSFAADNDITAIRFDSDGAHLVVAYDDGKIELWDTRARPGKLLWFDTTFHLPVLKIDFMDDLNQIVVVYKYAGFTFINKETGKISKTFVVNFNEYVADEPERLSIADINMKKGLLAVSGNVADRVLLIQLATAYKSRKDGSDSIYVLNSNDWDRIFPYPEETSLVVSQRSSQPRDLSIVKDLSSDIENFSSDADVITTVRIDPDGNFVLAGTKSGKLIQWDLKDTAMQIFPIKILPIVPSKDITDFKDILDIDAAERMIYTVCFYSSSCGQMQAWDAEDLSLDHFIKEADPSTCRKIRLSPDKKYAVTTGDFSYRVWKILPDSFVRTYDILYKNSVGYRSKTSSVDFYNSILAVGDKQNVFFYDMENMNLLYDIRGSNESLKLLQH